MQRVGCGAAQFPGATALCQPGASPKLERGIGDCDDQAHEQFRELRMQYAPAVMIVFALLNTVPATAGLQLSADGLTVYDSINNITWLADVNTPATNGFGLPSCNGSLPGTRICINFNGSMNYNAAAAWVAAMNQANYLGHSDWQLPTTPLTDKNCGKVGPNGASFGFGCTAGALDSMYNALGLQPPNSAVPVTNNSVGPFSNIQPYLYWSQASAGQTQGNATFSFATGWQGANTLPNFLYVWPMAGGRIPGIPAGSGSALQISSDRQSVYDPMTDITWLANADLPATNTFGLPRCTDPTTPAICIAQDGSMTYASAVQYIANMNNAVYLGQKNWQMPSIDSSCPGYECAGNKNPLGNLYYSQLAFIAGTSVPVPKVAVGPFHNIQPYLYWTCGAAAIQSPCSSDQPAPNFEWSYSFGSGFQGTDLLANSLYVTAYFIGNRTSSTGPEISYVDNAAGESPTIAPNTWVEVKGVNLAQPGNTRVWNASDFVGSQMPTQLDHVSVTVNGKSAYVYYISPTQINILTPPDAMSGPVQVLVNNSGSASATFTAQAQPLSPSFFVFTGGIYAIAAHPDGTLVGPPALYPGSTTPARQGETIMIYANGFGPTSAPVISGSVTQGGFLSPAPVVTIGGKSAVVAFAGLISPGLFQFNVVVPPDVPDGDLALVATYGGSSTQPGTSIAVQH